MDPSPEGLYNHLKRNYPGGTYHTVYEAGFCGFWIHRALTDLGINNIVTNPADVPTTHKEKHRRRDSVDSAKLSRELAGGTLRGIYIPDPFHEQLRSLCRLYCKSVSHQTRLKNRIRSFLYQHGIETPCRDELSPWSGRFIQWLAAIRFDHEPAQSYLRHCLDELKEIRERIKTILKQLRTLGKSSPIKEIVHDYLMSVSGVGFKTAMIFYSEVIDMNRFPNFDHLACYVGFVPDMDASGEKEVNTGLTFRQNRYLRYLLIQAAWVAIRKDSALTLKFQELIRRMNKQKAIIRIAKKLLSRMRYVWLNKTQYETAIVS